MPSHVHVFKLPNTSTPELPGRCGCKLQAGGATPCSKAAFFSLPDEGDSFAREFHVAALNWTSDRITVSLDGKVVNTIASPCLVEEIGMDFDREVRFRKNKARA